MANEDPMSARQNVQDRLPSPKVYLGRPGDDASGTVSFCGSWMRIILIPLMSRFSIVLLWRCYASMTPDCPYAIAQQYTGPLINVAL